MIWGEFKEVGLCSGLDTPGQETRVTSVIAHHATSYLEGRVD